MVIILMVGVANATNYQADPTNCPVEYNSVSCTGGELQCGIDSGSGGPYCYDMTSLNPPAGSTSTSSENYGSYDGGYVVDCEGTDGAEPYCDNSGNLWCDKMDSCYNVGRQTTCTGGAWNTATCSASCRTDGNNFFACDGSTTDGDGCEIRVGDSCGAGTGSVTSAETCYDSDNGNCVRLSDYLDCDDDDGDATETTCNGPNGCEINPGSSCSVGALSGTYANQCSGGAGVCVVDKSYFETGTDTTYQTNTTEHFLWGTDYGSIGDLLHLNNTNYGIFSINASGCLIWMDGTTACTAPTGSEGGGNPFDQDLNTTSNVSFHNVSATGKVCDSVGCIGDGGGSMDYTNLMLINKTNTMSGGNRTLYRSSYNYIGSDTSNTLDLSGSVGIDLEIGGDPRLELRDESVTFGNGVEDVDFSFYVNGFNDDGGFLWRDIGSANRWEFLDDLLIFSSNFLFFRDQQVSISSPVDGELHLVSDSSINISTPKFCLSSSCDHYYNESGVECWDDDSSCDRYIDGTGTNFIIQT